MMRDEQGIEYLEPTGQFLCAREALRELLRRRGVAQNVLFAAAFQVEATNLRGFQLKGRLVWLLWSVVHLYFSNWMPQQCARARELVLGVADICAQRGLLPNTKRAHRSWT
jgi:hypothetical protein